MWGSTIPSDYYSFYCSPKLQYFYFFLVFLLDRSNNLYLKGLLPSPSSNYYSIGYVNGNSLQHLHNGSQIPHSNLSHLTIYHVLSPRPLGLHPHCPRYYSARLGGAESTHVNHILRRPRAAEFLWSCHIRSAHPRAMVSPPI